MRSRWPPIFGSTFHWEWSPSVQPTWTPTFSQREGSPVLCHRPHPVPLSGKGDPEVDPREGLPRIQGEAPLIGRDGIRVLASLGVRDAEVEMHSCV